MIRKFLNLCKVSHRQKVLPDARDRQRPEEPPDQSRWRMLTCLDWRMHMLSSQVLQEELAWPSSIYSGNSEPKCLHRETDKLPYFRHRNPSLQLSRCHEWSGSRSILQGSLHKIGTSRYLDRYAAVATLFMKCVMGFSKQRRFQLLIWASNNSEGRSM